MAVIHNAPPPVIHNAPPPVIHDAPPPVIHDAPPQIDGPTIHTQLPDSVPQPSSEIDGWVRKYSTKWSVPYGIARGLFFKESSYNPNAPDTPGGEPGVVDVGLGQVGTDVGKSEGLNVRVPEQNVEASMRYLSGLHGRFGSWETALAAYNAGPGNVESHNRNWSFDSSYVSSIMSFANAVDRQLGASQKLIQAHTQKVAQTRTTHTQHPKTFADQFFTVAHNVASSVGNMLDSAIGAVSHPLPADPKELARQQAYARFGSSGAGATTQSMANNVMTRATEVGEIVPEAFNAKLRDIGANGLGGMLNGPGSQALRNTLINPNLTLGQKLDAAYNELGINSPGELAYWSSQPGIRDILATAKPSTPGGALLQLMLAGHADVARWKAPHAHIVGAETLGLELFNPTLPAIAKGTRMVAAYVASKGGAFADAAINSAHMRIAEQERLLDQARQAAKGMGAPGRQFNYKPTKANLPDIPHKIPTIQQGVDQFADLQREHNPATSVLGRAHGGSAQTIENAPATITLDDIKRDLAVTPVVPEPMYSGYAHAPEPKGWAYQAGKKFGYSFPELTKALGKPYEFLGAKLPGLPLFGDRYLGFAKMYGPLGEAQAAGFVANHAQLREENVMNVISPDLYGGLNQRDRIQLSITTFKLPQYLSGQEVPPPEVVTPRDGGSILQRALRISQKNMQQWSDMNRLDPDVARNFQQPQMVVLPHGLHKALGLDDSYDAEPGKPMAILNYHPQLTTWANQEKFRTVTRGGFAGMSARPATVRRVRSMQDVIDENHPISKQWNPAGDLTIRWNGIDHYLEFLRQVKDAGSTTMIPGLGVPATLPIEYEWPGSRYFRDSNPQKDINFSGAFIPWGDTMLDLDKPFHFGFGRQGFERFKEFQDKASQVYARLIGKDGADDGDRGAILRATTAKFEDKFPQHEIHASEHQWANAPGLKGYAVERTYLHQAMDANPRIRYSIGMEGQARPSGAALEDVERAFADLKHPEGDRLQWNNMTAQELAQTHFAASLDDDPFEGMMSGYDMLNSIGRTVALSNFLYHPLFNSYPALTSLLLEHAGFNPAKIMRYGTGITRALGVGWYGTGTYFLKEAASVAGKNLNTWRLPTWLDLNPQWLNRAKQYNALSKGFGMGLPAADYVRLMSFPTSDLPAAQRFARASIRMQEINKKAVFDIQEAGMIAYVHHVLVDEEGLHPAVAARKINKAVNDYTNLVGPERQKAVGRMLWFYPWFRMQMHRAWNLAKNNPQIIAAYGNAIMRNNQTMGDPNPSISQIDLWPDGKGGFTRMSGSMATYRYPVELSEFFDFALGNITGSGNAAARVLTGNLAPFPSAGARIISTIARTHIGQPTTPQDWDAMTGIADTQQPLGTMAKQAAWSLVHPLIPYGAFPSTYTYLSPKVAGQMRGIAEQIRKEIAAANRRGDKKTAAEGAALVTRLDNQDPQSLAAARAFVSEHEASGLLPRVRN